MAVTIQEINANIKELIEEELMYLFIGVHHDLINDENTSEEKKEELEELADKYLEIYEAMNSEMKYLFRMFVLRNLSPKQFSIITGNDLQFSRRQYDRLLNYLVKDFKKQIFINTEEE